MCQIAGIWKKLEFNLVEEDWSNKQDNRSSIEAIRLTAPWENYRLTAPAKLQLEPLWDPSGRYSIIFCGNIYNSEKLVEKTNWKNPTSTHRETALQGIIQHGSNFLSQINGDFVLAFYDAQLNELLLARDRHGSRPLYYSFDNGRFIFSGSFSDIANLISKKEINHAHLATYLQLSYSPAPQTVLKNVFKLEPGHFLKISESGGEELKPFYQLYNSLPFGESQPSSPTAHIKSLLIESVNARLQNQKSVGTFLSGGIDSSVISMLARNYNPKIPAFSLGFPDHSFFNETERAQKIAKHLNIEHHLIEVSDREINLQAEDILNSFDEPFADSSAILIKFLSIHTKRHVNIALSGDGADEIMGGYNKHRALLQSLHPDILNKSIKWWGGILRHFPESRNSEFSNAIRKIKRYRDGLVLNFQERYFRWSAFTPRAAVNELLLHPPEVILPEIQLDENDFNSVLRADTKMVLPNDMLYKIHTMGRGQNLDIRAPFLDAELVDFLFSLPASEKINRNRGKIILHAAFENDFPSGFFQTPKKGFEAPLSTWLKDAFREISNYYLSADFLKSQGIFSFAAVEKLKDKSRSDFPGDSPHTLWALIVFQSWYSRHFNV